MREPLAQRPTGKATHRQFAAHSRQPECVRHFLLQAAADSLINYEEARILVFVVGKERERKEGKEKRGREREERKRKEKKKKKR